MATLPSFPSVVPFKSPILSRAEARTSGAISDLHRRPGLPDSKGTLGLLIHYIHDESQS